jgi:Protein of unknown function (DUF3592)
MEPKWVILCGLLAIPGLTAAALIWIQVQDARVRSWRQASGRVVSSQPVARTIRRERHRAEGRSGHTDFVTDETIETRNFAAVAYEFVVAGKTYRGSRIDLAVDSGNFEVAETLKRYPEGAIVTVFYDPEHPDQCILERDDPKNLRKGWLSVVVMVVLIVGGVLGVEQVADIVRGAIAHPKRTPLVMALGLFGIVIAVFARMVGQKKREMRSWTTTAGRIVQSAVATTVRTHDKPSSMRRDYTETIYVPRIVYRYDADGRSFEGDDIGGAWSGSTPAIAQKTVARFPLDTAVTVFFNPGNPTESTLAPGVGYIEIVLWTVAALLAAAAVAADIVPGLISR